jgi:hypothetical protein
VERQNQRLQVLDTFNNISSTTRRGDWILRTTTKRKEESLIGSADSHKSTQSSGEGRADGWERIQQLREIDAFNDKKHIPAPGGESFGTTIRCVAAGGEVKGADLRWDSGGVRRKKQR